MMDFNSLNLERKYWFLGLFYTDGSFNGKNTVAFNQQKQDRDILEKVCHIFRLPLAKLHDNRRKKPSGETGEYVELRFQKRDCPSLMEFLKTAGFGHNKTFDMPLIDMPEGAIRHFLRGVIDGDGCIVEDNVLRLIITAGCEKFADYIMSLFRKLEPRIRVHKYMVPAEKKELATHDLYHIDITGKDAEKILLKIYDACEFYGQRKFRNFLNAKNQYTKKVSIYRSWATRKGVNLPIQGVEVREGKAFQDSRGYLSECYRCDTESAPTHLVYTSLTYPGVKRGPHVHLSQTDIFTFGVAGLYKIWLLDDRESSPTYRNVQVLYGGRDHWLRVTVPPGVVHAYQNISEEDGLSINCVSRLYAGLDHKYEVDEIRLDDTEFAEFLFGL